MIGRKRSRDQKQESAKAQDEEDSLFVDADLISIKRQKQSAF
jgi:hypothetical protein